MLIYVIDDEALLAKASERMISETVPEAEVKGFLRASDALEQIEALKEYPDVVFSDIQMPGITGLELAIRLKTVSPKTKVIFVTGYSEYALEAWKVRAHGYIMKPLEPERIREELAFFREDHPDRNESDNPDKLRVQCFGYFELFYHNEPVRFERRKTKELFAYLIDKRGRECTPEEIAGALWEDESDLKLLKNRIRVLINDLRATLRELGVDDVLIRYSGSLAVRTDKVDCDVYRMLDGDMSVVNRFTGKYMEQYSWAELTNGNLYFEYMDEKR